MVCINGTSCVLPASTKAAKVTARNGFVGMHPDGAMTTLALLLALVLRLAVSSGAISAAPKSPTPSLVELKCPPDTSGVVAVFLACATRGRYARNHQLKTQTNTTRNTKVTPTGIRVQGICAQTKTCAKTASNPAVMGAPNAKDASGRNRAQTASNAPGKIKNPVTAAMAAKRLNTSVPFGRICR